MERFVGAESPRDFERFADCLIEQVGFTMWVPSIAGIDLSCSGLLVRKE